MLKITLLFAFIVVSLAQDVNNMIDDENDVPDHIIKKEQFLSEAILAHNKYRKIHGVPPLVLNNQLTKFAFARADALSKSKSLITKPSLFRNEPVGESVGQVSGSEKFNGVVATELWYSEIGKYEFGEPGVDGASFTQMIWKNTREVGFGVAADEEGQLYFVAEYYPTGNVPGQYVDNVFQISEVEGDCTPQITFNTESTNLVTEPVIRTTQPVEEDEQEIEDEETTTTFVTTSPITTTKTTTPKTTVEVEEDEEEITTPVKVVKVTTTTLSDEEEDEEEVTTPVRVKKTTTTEVNEETSTTHADTTQEDIAEDLKHLTTKRVLLTINPFDQTVAPTEDSEETTDKPKSKKKANKLVDETTEISSVLVTPEQKDDSLLKRIMAKTGKKAAKIKKIIDESETTESTVTTQEEKESKTTTEETEQSDETKPKKSKRTLRKKSRSDSKSGKPEQSHEISLNDLQ